MADTRKISPIVTDADRQWALAQKPVWWDEKARVRAEKLNPDDPHPLAWEDVVAEEAEAFERWPDFRMDRKTPAEWSGLWRRMWWPKMDLRKLFPKLAPSEHEGEPHPFWKQGTRGFDEALKLATPEERVIWERFGVAQMKPNDPRIERLKGKAA